MDAASRTPPNARLHAERVSQATALLNAYEHLEQALHPASGPLSRPGRPASPGEHFIAEWCAHHGSP